ncbi:MAG: lytic transglycosylase domain-containing protein [Candidatus Caenarcaniphilales bacterium]|nr:lytic transglycosylase domain-containing protein [Candidatus Caenarcaniphilales bacterium]
MTFTKATIYRCYGKLFVLCACFLAICSNSPAIATGEEVEMLLGDQKLIVDKKGELKREIPEILTPEGFTPVIQPAASMPSNQVSQAYAALKSPNNLGNSVFLQPFDLSNYDLKKSALGVTLADAFKHPQVRVNIEKFHKPNKRVATARERLVHYRPIFESIFAQEGVPKELISIGFVESTFNPNAVSPAGARGLWQFIPSTGRHYGLQTAEDFGDPVKSTTAAARYLRKLHARFGDWLLAIAAYNAGDTRVQQAINMSNGSKNFWEVARYLPTETRNYVPLVIAATTLFGSIESN